MMLSADDGLQSGLVINLGVLAVSLSTLFMKVMSRLMCEKQEFVPTCTNDVFPIEAKKINTPFVSLISYRKFQIS